MNRTAAIALGLALLGTVSVRGAAPAVDYAKDIKPLLRERCYACHGALKQNNGLRLDTAELAKRGGKHGPALVARKPEQSLLLSKVSATNLSERMPPEGDALKPEQIELLRRWIAAGAPGPKDERPEPSPSEHWAFRPVVRPQLPKLSVQYSVSSVQSGKGRTAAPQNTEHWKLNTSPTNPIDAFVSARLSTAKLTPLPPADKPTLLRRVYLDLLGLPPTREELHAFLADPAPDAYERVVDRLLNSPQHGERWARHWMDVWRYSDWFGRRQVPDVWNSAPQIWRWRDWIVKSLNADHGYDRMVKEMLAADEVAPLDDETAVATGYLVRNWYALNPNEWMRANVEHTGKAFLGLTFNCAHCHDHKYDPITQADYFSFRAFFEPLYVRQDRWPGEADPGPFQDYDYSKLRKVQRLGSVRVFDKDAAAKTWFYSGGDERNRDTNRPPALPAMPAFLGGKSLQVTPVSLPPAAYYPGLRTAIQDTELKERRAAIATAEAELAALKQTNAAPTAAQRDALTKAEADFNTALAEAAKSGKPAALAGKQSLVLDATAGRRVLSHSLAGLPELADGASVRYQLRILTDKYAGFQLAKDLSAGLTAAYVGFVGGKIHSYKPGTTTEFEAGRYAFTNGQHAFEVTLALEPKADRALLTVRSLSDGKTLVDQTPIAINGWNPAKNKSQGLLLDAQAGTVAVWDELSVSAGSGKNFHFDFEPPRYADGKDAVGIEGWEAARFSAAPATSAVSSIALNRSLADKRLAVLAARRVLEVPSLAVAAAESKLTAARAELRSSEARLAADTAKHGRADLPVGLPASDTARSASLAEREAAVVSAKSKLAAAQFALAEAETKSATNTTRAASLTAAGKQLTDSQAALTKAEAALADPKLAETYTAFSPVYPRESTGRRKALAEWIGSPSNPLTARVAVNHIWARHFHEPLVASVFDFGRSGKPPTHPELLDWLAAEFMESGWSMKHLHRLIVTSAAYRRSSSAYALRITSYDPVKRNDVMRKEEQHNATADPENRLLWRMNPGRMEAEVVRDSLLHLAGALDPRMGGQELENKDALTTTRRSLYYSFNPESDGRSEFSALFDAPDPNDCYRRTRSIIPQQALALTNSKLVHDHAPAIAKRLGAPATDNAAFITAAFEQILTRPPSHAELAECEAFLARAGGLQPPPANSRGTRRVRGLPREAEQLSVKGQRSPRPREPRPSVAEPERFPYRPMSSPKPTPRAGDLQSPPVAPNATGAGNSNTIGCKPTTDGDYKSPARASVQLAPQRPDSVFFNKDAPVRRYRNWLPHWRQPGKWYFVTFRLVDSLAQTKLKQWMAERKLWMELHPEPWSEKVEKEYHRRFTAQFEGWLDAGEGECVLRREDAHEAVASALQFFAAGATDGDSKSPARDIRYELGDFVVMPNHVHVLVRPLGIWELELVLQSWKTFTAKAINRTFGRVGTVWWKDNFDHLVRSAEKFAKFQHYVADNPAKANLKPGEYHHHRTSLCYLSTPP